MGVSRLTSIALLTCLAQGCAAAKSFDAGAAAATSTIAFQAEGIRVRPSEVAWKFGRRARYKTALQGSTLQRGEIFGVLGSTPQNALPPAVREAASRMMAKYGADGVYLNHYHVDTESLTSGTVHHVSLGGYLLELEYLGEIPAARHDKVRVLADRAEVLRERDQQAEKKGLTSLGRAQPPRAPTGSLPSLDGLFDEPSPDGPVAPAPLPQPSGPVGGSGSPPSPVPDRFIPIELPDEEPADTMNEPTDIEDEPQDTGGESSNDALEAE